MTLNNGTICGHCHQPNEPGTVLCIHCGEALIHNTTVWNKAQLQDVERLAPAPQVPEFEPDTLYFYVASATNQSPLKYKGSTPVILGRTSESDEDTLIDFRPYHAHSLGVSRRHAQIDTTDAGYTVEDLESANGTWLNGNRLQTHQRYQFRSGDHIQLGELVVFVYFNRSNGSPSANTPGSSSVYP